MADVESTLKLKRKREGAQPQRKKAKTQTQKKSKASDAEHEPSTPVKVKPTESTGKPAAMPVEVEKDESTSQTKGRSSDPATSTPSDSRKDKKSKSKKDSGKSQKEIPSKSTEAPAASSEHGANGLQHPNDEQAIAQNITPQTSTANDNRIDRSAQKENKKKKKKSGKYKNKLSEQWSLSAPQGGWFLPQDPIFSPDEKYLVLAKSKAVEVYSTETSLMARKLAIGGHGLILACAMSSAHPDHLYVADSNGIVALWNWTDGVKVGRWDIGAHVRHLAVVKQPGSSQDLIFSHEVGSCHVVNVHALRRGDQASKTELKQVLKTNKTIKGLQVMLEGKIIIASCARSIIIGRRKKLNKTAVQDFDYTWREFETSKAITTFNAHVVLPGTDQNKRQQPDPRDHLNLAIGDEEGAILLFEDIVGSFVAIERSQKEQPGKMIGLEGLRPKRLHWHRKAVGSLKWSLDGNYLISGGDETVLTIWQLSTGKQQHLPHLTAAIENIVVSPSGASYALSLANNSVIVLSTSEFNAKTNIISVQSRRIDPERLPQESNLSDYSFALFEMVPMAVASKDNDHIIIATPSSQSRRQRSGLISEPYAETFDIATQHSVSRQALTRNNATDPNIDPEGNNILEPSVKFLQISHDGAWLATIDEWVPPHADMNFIGMDTPDINEEERNFRREVYLKIWRWDEKNGQWVLDARIDAPHFFEGESAHARVLDLVPDPSSTGFATVGEDRFVRIWKPKTRIRNGIVVRGADRTQGLVTWSIDRSIKIANATAAGQIQESSFLHSCRLAFSTDGSVLAAGVSWASEDDPGIIHIIDPDQAVIRRSITEFGVTTLCGLAIIGRYLVAISRSIVLWDMVTEQLVHSIPLETPQIDDTNRAKLIRFAVNQEDGTFAVSVPRFEGDSSKLRGTRGFLKPSTKVSIFDATLPKARWTENLTGNAVLALAAAKSGRGYIMLDGSSSIRVISPKTTAAQLPTPPPESASHKHTNIMDIVEPGDNEMEEANSTYTSNLQLESSGELLLDFENDKPIVRPEQLQELFENGPSQALPSVRTLFDAVVGLYARKPRASSTA